MTATNVVPMAVLLEVAYKNGYAHGAFNVVCLSQVDTIIHIHRVLRSPAIIQAGVLALGFLGGAADYRDPSIQEIERGIERIAKRVFDRARLEGVKTTLHADHVKDIAVIKLLVEAGFTSVMIDGSHLDYEDNISLTREAVEVARPRGVTVEAELGVLSGIEEDLIGNDSTYTNPNLVPDFLKRSGADCLALSYGTSHGLKKGSNPRLRKEIVIAARENLLHERMVPLLVSHGSSTVPHYLVSEINRRGGNLTGTGGIGLDMLRDIISAGISKINIDTDIRLGVTRYVRALIDREPALFSGVSAYLDRHPEEIDLRMYLADMQEQLVNPNAVIDKAHGKIIAAINGGTQEVVGQMIVHFGSAGMAWE